QMTLSILESIAISRMYRLLFMLPYYFAFHIVIEHVQLNTAHAASVWQCCSPAKHHLTIGYASAPFYGAHAV
ncbi:MAG: hypothetical protein M0R06_22590, partial [Sphaerochaeta sp.]|nr:hypothetical protein [Sphaerochaeta sp.]